LKIIYRSGNGITDWDIEDLNNWGLAQDDYLAYKVYLVKYEDNVYLTSVHSKAELEQVHRSLKTLAQ
jgi:hypothetical protein